MYIHSTTWMIMHSSAFDYCIHHRLCTCMYIHVHVYEKYSISHVQILQMTPDEQQWYKEYIKYHNSPMISSSVVRTRCTCIILLTCTCTYPTPI